MRRRVPALSRELVERVVLDAAVAVARRLDSDAGLAGDEELLAWCGFALGSLDECGPLRIGPRGEAA